MSDSVEYLPRKILKMIELLHNTGYPNIYIYSGMSPSGLNWRFSIGNCTNGRWPSNRPIVSGSVRSEGDTEWCKGPSSTQELYNAFILFYNLEKTNGTNENSHYVRWFKGLLNMLEKDKALIFYADYDAPHKYLLKYAPGYITRNA